MTWLTLQLLVRGERVRTLLVVGCTAVVKPSEFASASMLGLAAGDTAGGASELGYSSSAQQAVVVAYHLFRHGSVDRDLLVAELAELAGDKDLAQYDTLIIDEAHERSLNIDFLLGWLKRLAPRRPDLKIIITSATLDPERLSKHFNDCPIHTVSGRTYPVEHYYAPPEENIANLAKAKGVKPNEITALVLDRPRHQDLIAAIRKVGAGVRLITDGDVAGVIFTTTTVAPAASAVLSGT